jgi:hypothetical protein
MKIKLEYDDQKDTISFGLNYSGSTFNEIATLPTQAFDHSFSDQLPYLPTSILPPAIRYLSPDHSIVLWERPPSYVPFNYTQAAQEHIHADKASQYTLRLPIPWQRYVLLLGQDGQIANLFMFFAKSEITSLTDDPMCQAPILNFYANSRLCPASYTSIKSYSHDILGAIEAAYEMVWSSGFNVDTVLGIKNFCGSTDRSANPLVKYSGNLDKMYNFWVQNTLETVMRWEWNTLYGSFNDFISRKDIYHDYTGKNHDKLVKFVFAAQNARNNR